MLLEVARFAIAVLRAAWRAAAFRSRPRTARALPSSATPRSSPRRSRWSRCASSTTAARATERYPYNANGSPHGITGLTTADGRFTILMPHPERVLPHGADVVAPLRMGRGFAVDADVPQRARMAWVIATGRRVAMTLTVYAIDGVTPVVDPTAFVHPSAVLIGDVIVGPRMLHRTVRVAARRFRRHRRPRRRQRAGLLRHARFPRHRHRSSRRTGTSGTRRFCTAASSARTRWSA